MKSLYEAFGSPATDPRPFPGTLETKQIETVDNDQSAPLTEMLRATHDLGTRFTASNETIDDDVVNPMQALIHADPPGTTLTASVETSDEDAASSLTTLW